MENLLFTVSMPYSLLCGTHTHTHTHTHTQLFGAVMSCPLKISDHFYGTGESFLFSFEDTSNLKVYHWTAMNNYCVKGNVDSIGFGSGE